MVQARSAPGNLAMLTRLTDMGFPEDECRCALAAAFDDPDRAVQYLTEGEGAGQTMAPAAAAEPRQSPSRKRPRSPTPPAAVRTTADPAAPRAPPGIQPNHGQLERVGDAVCATPEQLVQLVRGLLRPNGGLTLQRTAKELDSSLEQLSRQRGWGQIQTRSSDGQMVPFRVTTKWLRHNAGPGSFEKVPKAAGSRTGAPCQWHSPHGDSRSVIDTAQVAAAVQAEAGRTQFVSDTGAGHVHLSKDAPAASTRGETQEEKLISAMAEFLRRAARQYTVAELISEYFKLHPSERKSMGGTKATEFLKKHGSRVFQLEAIGHGQVRVSLSSQHATANSEQANGTVQHLTEGEGAGQTMAPAAAAEPRQSPLRKRPRSPTPPAAVRTTAQLQLERVGDAVCATPEQLVQLVRGLLRPNGGPTLQRTAKELDSSLEQLSRQRGWGQIQTRSSDGQMVPFHVTKKWLQRNAGAGSFEKAAGGPTGAPCQWHSPHGDSRSVIDTAQVAAAVRSRHVTANREQAQPKSKRPQRTALQVGDRVQAAPDAKGHRHLCNAEIGLVESVIEQRGGDGGDTVVQVRAACGHLEWYQARDVELAGGAFFPSNECVQWALAWHGKSENTELSRARDNEVHARKQVAEERGKFKQAELEVMTLRNKLQLAEDKLASAVAAAPAAAQSEHQARKRSERPRHSGQETSCERTRSHSRSGAASMEASIDRTAPDSSPSDPEMAELLRDEEPEQRGSWAPTVAVAGPSSLRAETVRESEYERQVSALKQFYKQHDPAKDEAACRAILDKRRQTAPHLHEAAWKLLCSQLASKYGAGPAVPSATSSPGSNASRAAAEAALSAQLDALRANNEALTLENQDQASRFAAAEASWVKERKLREALVLKAQIVAAEARRELERKKREDSSAAAENVRPSGVDSNVNDGDTVSAHATAAQDCEARLLATTAIARDAASRFRVSLLSIVDALVPSTTVPAAANSTTWAHRHAESVGATPCEVATNGASAAANFIDLLQRYSEESLGLVEELARPDSEASREVVALARAKTAAANDAMSTASAGQVVPASAAASS